ncbi:MAG TPA: hypothetical protein VGM31_10070 [Puia sp.]|jgi:hypothetical protein
MRYLSIYGVAVVLVMTGLSGCHGSDQKKPSRDTVVQDVSIADTEHVFIDSTLSDGTLGYFSAPVKFRAVKDSRTGNRTYELDGEAFLTVRDADKRPFVIRTRQLIITLQSPYARLHIDAFASSSGEQADLLEGQLKVTKSYHSTTDNEPETLHSGDMVMINKDIDLMEKETLDSAERKTVEKKFARAARNTEN